MAASIGTEYRQGIPSVEAVEAHWKRGGWWQHKREHRPVLMMLRVSRVNERVEDRTPHIWSPDLPSRDRNLDPLVVPDWRGEPNQFTRAHLQERDPAEWLWRPCTEDGDSLPWPGEEEAVSIRTMGAPSELSEPLGRVGKRVSAAVAALGIKDRYLGSFPYPDHLGRVNLRESLAFHTKQERDHVYAAFAAALVGWTGELCLVCTDDCGPAPGSFPWGLTLRVHNHNVVSLGEAARIMLEAAERIRQHCADTRPGERSPDLTDDLCGIAEALGLEAEPPNCDTSSWTFAHKGPASVSARIRESIVDFIRELESHLRVAEVMQP